MRCKTYVNDTSVELLSFVVTLVLGVPPNVDTLEFSIEDELSILNNTSVTGGTTKESIQIYVFVIYSKSGWK